MNLILASASPRRQELLRIFGCPFTVRAADIDETMDPDKAPFDEVARVSRQKAQAIAAGQDDVIIAADTIVVCCGKVLGKPRDAQDARRMLSLLSGRDHQVMTGCTVVRGSRAVSFTEVTDLHFRPLLPQEIQRYILTLFCQRMEGDYYNVMGLPLCRLGQVLRDMAPEIWEDEAK